MEFLRPLSLAGLAFVTACGADSTTTATVAAAVSRVQSNPDVAATTGVPFSDDPRTVFAGTSLTYSVSFAPDANGLTATGGAIAGTPVSPGATTVIIAARGAAGAAGDAVADTFTVYTFATGLATPALPVAPYTYADAEIGLPAHFTAPSPVAGTDNTPATNPVTDAGAALGRALFYDPRLSGNDRVSCSSCHLQALGFSDTARFSHGFQGGLTTRHAMSLGNGRYYARGKFFWDERAATLEVQTLTPIQNAVEMGMTLDNLMTKLELTPYYGPLFQAAFGTPDITSDRVSRALAQFVRSMSTYQSRYDRAVASGNFSTFTAQEQLGMQLFMPVPGGVPTVGCDRCHTTAAQVSDNIHNNGLDVVSADTGAGGGRFKAPSLRNVGLRTAFMHDGRFTTLRQVIDHYNSGVLPGPNVDPRLLNPDGSVHLLNLSSAQMDAMVAFLNTLTDSTFITNPKFANPFVH